jgi:hypothetical protein
LPTVYSSEDWQAAFGFQTELSRSSLHVSPKSSPSPSPRISFSNEDFIDAEEAYTSASQFNSSISDNPASSIASSLLANTPASKFMADFQQNSLQQRLAMQVRMLGAFISFPPYRSLILNEIGLKIIIEPRAQIARHIEQF